MTPRDLDDEQLTAAWHRLCGDWRAAPVGSQRRRVLAVVIDDVCDERLRRTADLDAANA